MRPALPLPAVHEWRIHRGACSRAHAHSLMLEVESSRLERRGHMCHPPQPAGALTPPWVALLYQTLSARFRSTRSPAAGCHGVCWGHRLHHSTTRCAGAQPVDKYSGIQIRSSSVCVTHIRALSGGFPLSSPAGRDGSLHGCWLPAWSARRSRSLQHLSSTVHRCRRPSQARFPRTPPVVPNSYASRPAGRPEDFWQGRLPFEVAQHAIY